MWELSDANLLKAKPQWVATISSATQLFELLEEWGVEHVQEWGGEQHVGAKFEPAELPQAGDGEGQRHGGLQRREDGGRGGAADDGQASHQTGRRTLEKGGKETFIVLWRDQFKIFSLSFLRCKCFPRYCQVAKNVDDTKEAKVEDRSPWKDLSTAIMEERWK